MSSVSKTFYECMKVCIFLCFALAIQNCRCPIKEQTTKNFLGKDFGLVENADLKKQEERYFKICVLTAEEPTRPSIPLNIAIKYSVNIDDPECGNRIIHGETKEGVIVKEWPSECEKSELDISARIIPLIGCCDPQGIPLEKIVSTIDSNGNCQNSIKVFVKCFMNPLRCK